MKETIVRPNQAFDLVWTRFDYVSKDTELKDFRLDRDLNLAWLRFDSVHKTFDGVQLKVNKFHETSMFILHGIQPSAPSKGKIHKQHEYL